MHHASNILALAASIALLALAGCSSPAQQTAAAAPEAGAALAAQADEHAMTGSRIPKRTSTDRMLKTVGSREARDAMDTSLRPLDANKAY